MVVTNKVIGINDIPKVEGYPLVEYVNNAVKFVSPSLPQTLLDWSNKLGPVFKLPLPGVQVVVIGDETLFKEVLLNTQVFVKGPLFNGLRDLLGESVLIEDGEAWMNLRRVINKAFSNIPMKRLNEIAAEQTANITQEWKEKSSINMSDQARALALDIIWRVMFEAERDRQYKEEVAEAFVQCVKFLNRASTVRLPFKFVPGHHEFRASNSLLKQVFNELVDETVAQRDGGIQSLASQLIEGYGTKELAISQLKTLVLAGHETTEITITWILYFLAVNQALQSEVKQEIEARYEPGSSLSDTDFPLLTATITEALRLWPTTFIIPRQAITTTIVGKYEFPAQTMVIPSTLLVQRSPSFNSTPEENDANEFNPYRFITNPALYQRVISFGYGPRKCLGANFAMEEIKQIIAYIVKNFSLNYIDQGEPVVAYNVGGISRPHPTPHLNIS